MLRLALPIVLSELGWTAMGIVDTLVVGRLPNSAESIAAVSLGTILFYTLGIFGSGLLLGLDPLVGHAHGAREIVEARHWLMNALYLTLPMAVVLMAALWGSEPLLDQIGEKPEVMLLMKPYLSTLTWSILPLLFYFGLRRYLQAVDATGPVVFALVSANVINFAVNVILVYGYLGAPRLGVTGSAWATVASRIYMALVLAVALLWREDCSLGAWLVIPEWQRMRRLLALGLPAGGQILGETGVFAFAAALIGRLNSASLAAHQIALNCASVTFMVTLGISSAAAVRVGQALGRKDTSAAARAGWTAFALGLCFMTCAAITFTTLAEPLARFYTNDPAVIGISVALLLIAALFQVFDGTQVVLAGALRGAGDTKTPMLCCLFCYWIVGLPLGALLCYRFHQGAAGIWIGLCTGLILIGTILVFAWRRQVRVWEKAVSL